MKKEELSWVFGGFEEGVGRQMEEKKKRKGERKGMREEDGVHEIE